MVRFRALSVKQPWANLIASGEKTIETRTWHTPYRGNIIICSSKRPDIHPAGYALCIAEIYDCRKMTKADEEAACCNLYPNAYSWLLRNIRPITPQKVKGQLGIFEIECEVKDAK